MKFFIKHLRATRSGVVLMLALQFALFLFGVFMVAIINYFLNDDRDYAAVGSLMALIGTVFGGLLRGNGAAPRYRMAVSMGSTRRSYLLADPAATALNCAAGIVFAWLLNKLELWLYALLYPGWELALDFMAGMAWWSYLMLVAGVCALDFCLGALQLKFGAKGFAAVWFPLCFAPMIFGNAVSAAKEGGTSLLAQLGRGVLFLVSLLTPAMWAAAGIALLLALVVLSVLFYRKAEVRA